MDYSLQNKINRRLRQLKRDGVKFISGTIAPADSCDEVGSIEPHFKALEYFESKEESINISVQLKWMGSRGTMYLFRDSLEKSFVVTRGGFKISYGSDRMSESKKFFKHWFKKVFEDEAFEKASEVILDGEIMPWNAIGEGLIQRQFVGYSDAVQSEIEFLGVHGFNIALKSTLTSESACDYYSATEDVKKKNSYRESYELLDEIFKGYDNYNQMLCIDKYDDQLENYNRSLPPFYVAFDILRIKYPDGSVMVDDGWLASSVTKYSFLRTKWPSDAKKMVAPITDAMSRMALYVCEENIAFKDVFDIGLPVGEDSTYEAIEKLMTITANYGFEGLMLKPEFPMDTTAVHALKLRNPEYLRLIYGHDYDLGDNLDTLIRKKRTSKKRKLSHNEYKLGIQMLKLKEDSPTYDEDFERIAKKILFDIEEESTVDSRL